MSLTRKFLAAFRKEKPNRDMGEEMQSVLGTRTASGRTGVMDILIRTLAPLMVVLVLGGHAVALGHPGSGIVVDRLGQVYLTLLHYLGANGVEPFRQHTPKNAVEIVAVLLDAGADVNAEAQMYGR